MATIITQHTSPLSEELRRIEEVYSGDPSDDGVYLTTNESGLREIRQILSKDVSASESCHIGVSGWHNFDIINLRRSAYGLIFDRNPNNKVFIEKTLQALKESASREDFVKKMLDFVKEKDLLKDGVFIRPERGALWFHMNCGNEVPREFGSPCGQIKYELEREGSFLATDTGFHYIKMLAIADKIVAITADILDTRKFKEIATIFQTRNIPIDTLYLSNICDYVSKTEKGRNEDFIATFHSLIQPSTFVITSSQEYCPSQERDLSDSNLRQRVFLGSTFSTPDDDSLLFPTE